MPQRRIKTPQLFPTETEASRRPTAAVPLAPAAVEGLHAKISFRTLGDTTQSLEQLKVTEQQVAPLMTRTFSHSSHQALTLSKAMLQRERPSEEKMQEVRELIRWGREGGLEQRKVVCTAFRQSRFDVALIHGIGELSRNDARTYMKDFFDEGGDIKAVAEWMEVAGGVLLKHGAHPTGTAGSTIGGWIGDAVDAVVGMIKTVADAIAAAGRSLVDAMKAVVNWTIAEISRFVAAIIQAGRTVAQILGEALKMGVAAMKKFVKALVEARQAMLNILSWAAAQVASVLRDVIAALRELGKSFTEIVASVVGTVAARVHAVVKAVMAAGAKIGQVLAAVAGRVVNAIRTVLEGVFQAAATLAAVVRSVCQEIATGFRRGFIEGLLAMGRGAVQILEAALLTGLSLVGVAFAVLAEIWGGHRGLTAAEMKEARRIFGWSIELDRVRIATASFPSDVVNWVNGQRPFTTMYIINFKSGTTIKNNTLIHELTHVWQAVVAGPVYMTEALHSQFFGRGYNVTPKDIEDARGNLRNLQREQQASVVEWYWDSRFGRNELGKPAGITLQLLEPLARQVFAAKPGSVVAFSELIPVVKVVRTDLIKGLQLTPVPK
jgi:hypothetical protein